MKTESEIKKEIVEICKRIHARGWISSTDGNVSVRLPRNRILITPSGVHKGFMKERDLITVDMNGKKVAGARKPSSEMLMHLACYDERPDVGAVIHAHPTMCVAFSLAGIKLAKCLLPEVVFTLGSIPTASYAPPATEEAPEAVRKHIKDFDAVILERHGSVTVGKDVFEAYNALERMEHVAEITYHARQLGSVKPLSAEQITRLQKIGEEQGWPKRKIIHEACNDCNACNKFSEGQNKTSCGGGEIRPEVKSTVITNPSDQVMKLITEEVTAAMKG